APMKSSKLLPRQRGAAKSETERSSSTKWRRPSASVTTIEARRRFDLSSPSNEWVGAMEHGKAEFFRTGEADPLLAWRTEYVDGLVRDAHRDLLASTPAAVLAVGGYGRKQLFPYSDVDLLILFEDDRAVEGSKKVL